MLVHVFRPHFQFGNVIDVLEVLVVHVSPIGEVGEINAVDVVVHVVGLRGGFAAGTSRRGRTIIRCGP